MAAASENLVFISVDDLNAYVTLKSIYPDLVETPNFDRLMKIGITFENAFSQVALCNPSRTSILTGLNPSLTGVHENTTEWYNSIEDPHAQTLPGMLQDAGFYTASFGKIFHNLPKNVSEQIFDVESTDRTNWDNDSTSENAIEFGQFKVGPVGSTEEHGDYINVSEAKKFLNSDAANNPFLLSVGLFRPHGPWGVPYEYFNKTKDGVTPPRMEGDLSDVPDFIKVVAEDDFEGEYVDSGTWAQIVEGYRASIAFADDRLGELLDGLAASGHFDNTNIVLWSDHGYHLGEKDSWHKFTLWDEAGRAPLIISRPEDRPTDIQKKEDIDNIDFASRVTVSQVVEMVDILPTVLDLLGVGVPTDLPIPLSGESLVRFLNNPTLIEDDKIAITTMYGSASIRTNDYRYTLYEDGSEELYNVNKDEFSYNNLINDLNDSSDISQKYLELREQLLSELHNDGWDYYGLTWSVADQSSEFIGKNNTFTLVNGEQSVAGGAGDDVYFVGADPMNSVGDFSGIIEIENDGNDSVYTSLNYQLPDNIENLFAKVNYDRLELTGNESDNRIVGGASAEKIYGMGGNDVLEGQNGDDTIEGGSGNDYIDAGSGEDTIEGGEDDDIIFALGGDDNIDGGDGNDTVSYMGIGNMTIVDLSDKDGDNVVLKNSNGETVETDSVYHVENIIGSSAGDILTGDEKDNVIEGGSGNDVIDGKEGSDTASYVNATERVIVNLASRPYGGGVYNTSGGANSDILSNIENIFGSAFDDSLVGDGFNNKIEGRAGNDTFEGGAGSDILDGGDGIDEVRYTYLDSHQALTIDLSAGTALEAGVHTDTLIAIENVRAGKGADSISGSADANRLAGFDGHDEISGGAGDDTLLGEKGNDRLDGGAGDDSLSGGSGNDVLDGGDGTDTVTYAGSTAAVTVNLLAGTASGEGNDTLALIENVQGSRFNDVLTGNDGTNSLFGGAGDDHLSGGLGDDVLDGGDGIDTARYASAIAAVTVDLSTGLASGEGNDTLTFIENVQGSSFNDVLTGNDGTNSLFGGAGDDHLSGGSGDDVFYGGAGADFFNGGNGVDTVDYLYLDIDILDTVGVRAIIRDATRALYPNTGAAAGDTYSDIENLLGTNARDTLIGDDNINNILQGRAGDDRLEGWGGNDLLDGGDGRDTVLGGNGADGLTGGAGNDVIDGGGGTDTTFFSGDLANYSLTRLGASIVVTDSLGVDGEDTLTNVEQLSFNGIVYNVNELVAPANVNGLAYEFGQHYQIV